ncbi:MAG: YegS/Rv2252/BmrU family lipid kinase [Candidatus Heimdallarchaeota archaeon]|nr:YegS/Rv2252/BmrU family lipid kinase [Candidatus Heimdallarchaeota archaeon]MCK4876829.1 YegS/Rv2252/BmrU family lipid kinase [Candidatus Heimdallarchaeota archaeon]
MVSYLFIVNPNARNGKIGKMWPKVESEIKNQNFDYSVELTKEPLHAIDIARDKGKDFDCIVATGGDGTVNEVANGVYEIDGTFGVLPLGNGNDFAFGHKYDDNYMRSLNILSEFKTLDLGVGIARCEDNERYFVNIVDTGVGATISVSSFTDAKWLKGFVKYYYLALKGITKYRVVPSRIKIDDLDEIKTDLVIMAVGFGNRFGGGFNVLPNNYGFREDFEIVIAGDVGKLYQYYLLNVLKPGKHVGKKGVNFYNGRKMSIEADKPLPIEVEGEIVSFGARSIEFEVAPRRIITVVPQELIDLKKEKSN